MRIFLVMAMALVLVGCGTVTVSGIQNSVDCSSINTTFDADVKPIFTSRGCIQSGCHNGTDEAGGLDLDGGGNATTIYNNIIAAASLDVANDPADPLNAILIAKPLIGMLPHEGGDAFLDLDDTDYQDIYCWIESGAANN